MCSVLSSRDKNLVFFPPHFPFPGLPSPVVSGCLRLPDELFQSAVAESTAVCVFSLAVWPCVPGLTCHCPRAVGLRPSPGARCWGLLARVRHAPRLGPPLRQLGPPHSMVAASCRRK